MNQEHLHIIAFTAKGTYEELLPLKKKAIQLEDVRFTFYEDKSNNNYRICISSKKTSQGIAISKIKDELSCNRVVCISDKMYDLSMFEAADVRVAMGNADEETKAAADIIIDSNDKSGLVKFLLEEYIKNKCIGKE
jgi:hydroxymethylpyrimidine pyrophosphatase-like HAD family hydrolase